jgi:hypothetical protein
MNEENIKIELAEGQTELIIRHGEAAPIHEPGNVSLTGGLRAPADWAIKRREQILAMKDTCHVEVYMDRLEPFIVLYIGEQDRVGFIEIIGKLTPSDHIKRWEDKEYDIPTFSRMIRKYKTDFMNPGVADELWEQISSFEAKIGRVLEDHDDNKGNIRQAFNQTLSTNVMDAVELNIPLFKDQGRKICYAEVLVHLKNGTTPVVELAITDLEEYREMIKDEEFNLVIDKINEETDQTLPVLYLI